MWSDGVSERGRKGSKVIDLSPLFTSTHSPVVRTVEKALDTPPMNCCHAHAHSLRNDNDPRLEQSPRISSLQSADQDFTSKSKGPTRQQRSPSWIPSKTLARMSHIPSSISRDYRHRPSPPHHQPPKARRSARSEISGYDFMLFSFLSHYRCPLSLRVPTRPIFQRQRKREPLQCIHT